jgi:hypothetical protein
MQFNSGQIIMLRCQYCSALSNEFYLHVRVLQIDVERLFSLTGLICSPLRARLSADMVNKQACLKMWLRDNYGIFDSTRVKARKHLLSSLQ